MKKVAYLCLLSLSLFSFSQAIDDDGDRYDKRHRHGDNCLNNVDIDIDDESVTITQLKGKKEVVEITSENKLYINDQLIKTTPGQEALLEDFRWQMIDLTNEAGRLGLEGARIGVEGAKIGIHATGGLFKALLTDYTCEELERDIERKAAQIEKKAEKLEKRAEKLEQLAEDIESTHEEMIDEIPELADLRWF